MRYGGQRGGCIRPSALPGPSGDAMTPHTYVSISSRLRSRRHRKTKEHAALQVWMNSQLEREIADEKTQGKTNG